MQETLTAKSNINFDYRKKHKKIKIGFILFFCVIFVITIISLVYYSISSCRNDYFINRNFYILYCGKAFNEKSAKQIKRQLESEIGFCVIYEYDGFYYVIKNIFFEYTDALLSKKKSNINQERMKILNVKREVLNSGVKKEILSNHNILNMFNELTNSTSEICSFINIQAVKNNKNIIQYLKKKVIKFNTKIKSFESKTENKISELLKLFLSKYQTLYDQYSNEIVLGGNSQDCLTELYIELCFEEILLFKQLNNL